MGQKKNYQLTTTKVPKSEWNKDPNENDNGHIRNDFINYKGYASAGNFVSDTATGQIDNQLDVDWFVCTGTGKSKEINLQSSSENVKMVLSNGSSNLRIENGDVLPVKEGEQCYIGVYVEDGQYTSSVWNNPSYTLTLTDKVIIPELEFTPVDGGSFIYSSNPEFIEESHLGENNNMLDNYENLAPGKYTYMAWYHNGTDTPIYTDVLLNAMNSATIKINRLGLQVFPNRYSPSWTGMQAYSDFLGQYIDNHLGADDYNPSEFYPTPLNLPLQYETSVWLSDIYQDAYQQAYPAMLNENMPIYAIMEFEVIGSPSTLSTVAYKTTTNKTWLNLTTSPYIQDIDVWFDGSTSNTATPTWKGITYSMPVVKTDTLYHSIEEPPNADNYAMPATVRNAFGTRTLTQWFTHLNPQNDIYNYQNVAESSMLGFDYFDSYDNAAWRFDTTRTSLSRPPIGYSWDGFTENDTLPFLELPPGDIIPSGYYAGLKKCLFSVSQGNYSVENIYNLEITNPTSSTWTFNYRTDAASRTVVGISVDGDPMQYACSGARLDNPRFVGRTVEIPSGAAVSIKVSVTLTAGDGGGISNEFYLAKKY